MFVRMLNEAEPLAIEFVEHEINDGFRRHKLGVPWSTSERISASLRRAWLASADTDGFEQDRAPLPSPVPRESHLLSRAAFPTNWEASVKKSRPPPRSELILAQPCFSSCSSFSALALSVKETPEPSRLSIIA